MTGKEIKELFLKFFEERGHKIVPSSSLLSDDPSVLFTTAGMQQFKPYYLGEKSPYGNNAASVQKCFRTSDIDSVGDESHLTFFEMLGNFSFGGYFKEEAIKYAYEFIAKKLKLKIDHVSIFEGDKENGIPTDEESEKIWKKIDASLVIKKSGKEDNFWGPTGEEGPCGPTTEIYVKNAGGKSIEIWNIVFNEYYKNKEGKFEKLKTPGVDTGMGLERLTMVVQNKPTIFETDLLSPLMNLIPKDIQEQRIRRIITDHYRGITFLIADGLRPSNKEQGYVLRRLIRRVMMHEYLNTQRIYLSGEDMFKKIIDENKDFYPSLDFKTTMDVWSEESSKFSLTLKNGLKEIDKLKNIDAATAFKLYESFGLSYELIKDYAAEKTKDLKREDFDKEFARHQEISRAGLEKKFGGHGLKEGGEIAGASEEEKQRVIKLHSATHLLHQALFDVLGGQIKQMGSDINSERLRFDFPFERKLTTEEIGKIEAIVNEKIKEALPVGFKEEAKDQAIAEGAKAFFKVKYPDQVKVYSMGDYSKEICNGPHVENTDEIGKFKILKEESVSAGVRRIKATIE